MSRYAHKLKPRFGINQPGFAVSSKAEPLCCLPLRAEPAFNKAAEVFTWEEFRAMMEKFRQLDRLHPNLHLCWNVAKKATACDHLVLVTEK